MGVLSEVINSIVPLESDPHMMIGANIFGARTSIKRANTRNEGFTIF